MFKTIRASGIFGSPFPMVVLLGPSHSPLWPSSPITCGYVAMLSSIHANSSIISHMFYTMPNSSIPLATRTWSSPMSPTSSWSSLAHGNRSSKSCSTLTHVSTGCLSLCIGTLLASTHSSSELSSGHGPFHTLNNGCLPFWIRSSQTMPNNTW